MKYHYYKNVTKAKLRNILPRFYHSLLPQFEVHEKDIGLLIFPPSESEVLISSDARKAIRKFEFTHKSKNYAVAMCVTCEAKAILEKERFVVLVCNEFYWTDQSYISVRDRV